MSHRFICLVAAILLAGGISTHAAETARQPNIVLIMADDFGYECVGANGGTSHATPHLDQLAAGGMRFEHCYSQPLCTPTRVQLMTGQYNIRNYVRFGLLDPRQTTFHGLRSQGSLHPWLQPFAPAGAEGNRCEPTQPNLGSLFEATCLRGYPDADGGT